MSSAVCVIFDCNIYIDAKAIEPGIVVKTESNPEVLKQRLTDSFIKGVIQTQCCARNLINKGILQKNQQDIALIVLLKDHFIANADDLIKDIDSALPDRLKDQNAEIFISGIALFNNPNNNAPSRTP